MQPQNPYQPQPPQGPQPGQATPVEQPVTPANSQFPVDYLNQIATPLPVKKVSPLVLFGIIGTVIVLAAVAVFMLIQSTAPPSAAAQLYSLQARIGTLDKITTEQGKHLTQSALSSINSTTGAMLKSMNTDIASYTKDRVGVTNGKLSLAAKNAEKSYYEELSTKFNNAYLTGTLDRVYSSEMAYQLSMLKSKMLSVKAVAKSKKYNDIYDSNLQSLTAISDKLHEFQNTK